MLSYQKPSLVLQRGVPADAGLVADLQRDLRALGYLTHGIDGTFGAGTELAVRALQHDLIHGAAGQPVPGGAAPVAIDSFNGAPGAPLVGIIDGVVDQALVACIAAMMADSRMVLLPSAADPAADNLKALAAITSSASTRSPMPFISAIVRQESGGRHFSVPSGRDVDNFVVLGADRDPADADRITSRGYGIGQYTLFHHPPHPDEVASCMLDPVRNVSMAVNELRAKFDGFLVGPADRADDRVAEHPLLPLRLCRYPEGDSRYMRDCATCARQVPAVRIEAGMALFPGSQSTWQATARYAAPDYLDVPDRAAFLCDWPYAVRRYNGGGIDSFHYQARVLSNLAALSTT